jgi:large subunit ribosomal protein L23
MKSEHLPATQAKFRVPLTFSKLDLRDYLWHAYNVRTVKIRSYVQQQRVTHDRPDATAPMQNKWFRPKAIKHMTVEMDKPFVWPEDPENWDAYVALGLILLIWVVLGMGALANLWVFSRWSKDIFRELQDEADNRDKPETRTKDIQAEMGTLAQQARELLNGKKKWKPTYVDYGAGAELEKDVKRDVKI